MIDWMRMLDPRAWIQAYPTCREWDAILNEQLDKHGAFRVDKFTARVGSLEVWVENWPYSYGYCYDPYTKLLPKYSTRRRLRKMVGFYPNDPLKKVKEALE